MRIKKETTKDDEKKNRLLRVVVVANTTTQKAKSFVFGKERESIRRQARFVTNMNWIKMETNSIAFFQIPLYIQKQNERER